MKSVLKILDKVFEAATIALFVAMLAVVTIQVFARYFLPNCPPWTEELARVFFVGAIAFAAPLGIKLKQYVLVDLIISHLRGKVLLAVQTVINIAISLFLFLVSYVALDFIRLGLMQRASTLDFPMGIPFSSIFISCFFCALYSALQIADDLRAFKNGGASK